MFHISAEQFDTDHCAGFDSAGILRRGRSAAGERLLRLQAQFAKCGGEGLESGGRESGERERRADLSQLAEWGGEIGERGERAGRAAGSGGRSEAGIGDHLLDGLDAGDGFFRKREAERDCAEQLSIDVDGTSAHALDDAGLGERTAAELGEHDALFGREVFENAEDFDLELFDPIAFKDGAADAAQSRADIFEGEKLLPARGGGGEKQEQGRNS